MAVPGGLALRRPDRLLEFFRETIHIHIYIVNRNSSSELYIGSSRTASPMRDADFMAKGQGFEFTSGRPISNPDPAEISPAFARSESPHHKHVS
jgi:hypothetical protein